MFLLTNLIMTIMYAIMQIFSAIDVSSKARSKAKTSEELFKWAQEHEYEWLKCTDLIVKENGKLMYYVPGYNNFDAYEVHYGWDNGHYQYGLIYKGCVVFGYNNLQWALANPVRVQYMNGKRLINLGCKRGINGDVYKVVGENKYYCYGKEVWMVDKGKCICRFSNDKFYDPKHKEKMEEIKKKYSWYYNRGKI